MINCRNGNSLPGVYSRQRQFGLNQAMLSEYQQHGCERYATFNGLDQQTFVIDAIQLLLATLDFLDIKVC